MALDILAEFVENDINTCITVFLAQNPVYRLIDGNNFIVDQRIKYTAGSQFRINSAEKFQCFFVVRLQFLNKRVNFVPVKFLLK